MKCLSVGCGVRHRSDMSPKAPKPKEPKPGDIRSAGQAALDAAQAAVDAAQAVASGAMRIPPASARFAAQLPDLLENLAATTERLDRYLSLAEPTLRTMDRLLPQLEALVATGEEIYGALSRIPGVSTLTRLAGGQASDDDSRSRRKK